MGLTSLDAKSLIGFPHSIAPPKDATGKELLYFDWQQNEKRHINAEGIKRVLEYIWSNGAGIHPQAIPFLSEVLDVHLRDKIIQQFKYMAKSYNKRRREEEEVDVWAVAAAEREAEGGNWDWRTPVQVDNSCNEIKGHINECLRYILK